jgi:cell division protein FtsL
MSRWTHHHYAFHPSVDNAFLVRERDRRRRRELVLILLAAVPLGLGLLGYSWIHQELLTAGYRIDHLERRMHDLRQEARRLELDAARLAGPERIDSAARDLGLVPPQPEQLVVWKGAP